MKLDAKLLEQLRYADAHTKPAGSEEDLHQYVKSYLKFHIPKNSVCKHHISPFRFLSDIFYNKQNNAIAFANRGGGKTLSVAILCHLNAIHCPLYSIANIAAEKQQAKRCYDYVKSFSSEDNEWFSMDRIFSTQQETRYRNGSTIQILTGSLRGCKSAHPHFVTCDEVDVMDWDVVQEVLLMGQSTKKHARIQIFLSTRQFVSGNMYKLLEVKPLQPGWPFKTYNWCIFETVERCTLSDCEQCKEIIRPKQKQGEWESWYDICHEEPERHPDGKCRASDGYILLKDVLEDFQIQDWSTFDTQKRCLRPGRKGLVFDTFEPEIHCKKEDIQGWWQRLREDRKREPERRHLEIAVIIDEGWAAPMAVLFVAKDKGDNLFLFDSIYETRLDTRDLVSMMRGRFQEYNIPMDFECRCDERSPRLIDDLNKLGLTVTAVGLGQDEQVGMIRQWLNGNYREGYPGAWIDPEKCYPLTVEIETLKYKLDREGNPRSELPDKGPDHLVNCWGYSFADFGLAGGSITIKVHRAEKPPTEPVKVPTRSDWMKRH